LPAALFAGSAVAVVWGALAFGAVYPWAFTPLAVLCALVGAAALAGVSRGVPPVGGLALGLGAIALATVVQMIPLPLSVLTRVSPGTDAYLSDYDFGYRMARNGIDADAASAPPTSTTRPITIAPDRTRTGLLLFSAFALFLLGLTRLLSVVGARPMVNVLIGFGIVLALIGIVQSGLEATSHQPLIYGFWKPIFDSTPFGPFVNPNHFAGWMVMTVPLALALFISLVREAGEAGVLRGRRLLAFISSPRFMSVAVVAGAGILMALSMLMTRSRSALGAFAVAALIIGVVLIGRQSAGRARWALGLLFAAVVTAIAYWAGYDTLASKFLETQGRKSAVSRLGAWRDTLHIVADFPLTGTGLDTYGAAMMKYQTTGVRHFAEAHNEYLQVAAEGGLLLGLPVLATIGLFVRDVRRRFAEAPREGSTYCLRVGAVAGLVGIALQSVVEFSLQMPGNAALFAVLGAVALHRSPHLRRGSTSAASSPGPRA
jgi:O-antigen ligase